MPVMVMMAMVRVADMKLNYIMSGKRLLQIRNDVFDRFNADRHADQAVADAEALAHVSAIFRGARPSPDRGAMVWTSPRKSRATIIFSAP